MTEAQKSLGGRWHSGLAPYFQDTLFLESYVGPIGARKEIGVPLHFTERPPLSQKTGNSAPRISGQTLLPDSL